MGKIEKCENTFFSYFLWVFLKLKSYKSVKIVLKSKFKNTSNHQNFMSMESKDRWDMTGGWVLRKFVKRNFFCIFYDFLKNSNRTNSQFCTFLVKKRS